MGVFCKLLTAATIRYVDRSEVDQAEAWIRADLIVADGLESAISVAKQKVDDFRLLEWWNATGSWLRDRVHLN
jgi:hypothetical protein